MRETTAQKRGEEEDGEKPGTERHENKMAKTAPKTKMADDKLVRHPSLITF